MNITNSIILRQPKMIYINTFSCLLHLCHSIEYGIGHVVYLLF